MFVPYYYRLDIADTLRARVSSAPPRRRFDDSSRRRAGMPSESGLRPDAPPRPDVAICFRSISVSHSTRVSPENRTVDEVHPLQAKTFRVGEFFFLILLSLSLLGN